MTHGWAEVEAEDQGHWKLRSSFQLPNGVERTKHEGFFPAPTTGKIRTGQRGERKIPPLGLNREPVAAARSSKIG